MKKRSLQLNGSWTIFWFDPGEGEKQKAYLSSYTPKESITGQVPGMVQMDMLKAGLIPDPFFGKNAEDIKWMEYKDWWYRREFIYIPSVDAKRVEMVFHGLDTFATIWLNGKKIGSHDNFFTPMAIDVTKVIKKGRNTIAVKLGSIWPVALNYNFSKYPNTPSITERMFIRKPQMSFGWDIAPRIITFGIWRPVELKEYGDINIQDVRIVTRIKGKDCIVFLEVTLRNNTISSLQGELLIGATCGKSYIQSRVAFQISSHCKVVKTSFLIKDAKLWWPTGSGPQNLYRLSIAVRIGGRQVDRYISTFGCREIELIQEPQENGRAHSFIFAVNGRKIYIKGTNWIPIDAIFSRVDKKRYDRVFRLAQNQGINMFRIWGGGIYEDDYFYQKCDRMGILVWQDFMFAGAIYPQEAWFLKKVRAEAEVIVRQLRNHPCIAIWCGDNEIERGWYNLLKNTRKPLDTYRKYIIHKLLRDICRQMDPSRPFITSSPTSPFGATNPDDPYEGDHHLWEFTRSYKDPVYSQDNCRFISEIGFLSMPWRESIERFIPRDKLWPMDKGVYSYHSGIACVRKIEEQLHLVERYKKAKIFSTITFSPKFQIEESSKITGGWIKITRFPSGQTTFYRFEVQDPLLIAEAITNPTSVEEKEFLTAMCNNRAVEWQLPDSDRSIRCALKVERLSSDNRVWHQQLFDVFVRKDNSISSQRLGWYWDPDRIYRMEEGVTAQGIPLRQAQTLDQYILYTQIAQAIALQSWMEHYRRRKWLCGGSLYWNLFDNWPQISDAVVDYYFKPKMAYYGIKRAYAPLLVSFHEKTDQEIEIWMVNDLHRPFRGTLKVILEEWSGKSLWKDRTNVVVPADSSNKMYSLDLKGLPFLNRKGTYLRASFVSDRKILAETFYFFIEPALIDPPRCNLTVKRKVSRKQKTLLIEINTDSFARYVYLKAESEDEILFSDNWFHLPAGQTRTVIVSFRERNRPPIMVSALNSDKSVFV